MGENIFKRYTSDERAGRSNDQHLRRMLHDDRSSARIVAMDYGVDQRLAHGSFRKVGNLDLLAIWQRNRRERPTRIDELDGPLDGAYQRHFDTLDVSGISTRSGSI